MAAHPVNPRTKGLLTREEEKKREKIERKRSDSSAGMARTTAADSSPGVIYMPRRGVDI